MHTDDPTTVNIRRSSAAPAERRAQGGPGHDAAFAGYLGEHLAARLRVAGLGLAVGAALDLIIQPEQALIAGGVVIFGLIVAALPTRWTAPAAPALAALFGVVTVGSVVLVPADAALAVGLGLTFVLALVLPLTLVPRLLALTSQAAMVLILAGSSPLDLLPTAVVVALAYIYGRQQERQWRALWEDRETLASLSERLHAESNHRQRAIQDREGELLSQQERMVQQEKWAALGRVAVGVGHEIKNPLQAAMSYLELAREGDVNAIDDAMSALSQIRELLLDLSQLRGANDVQEVQTFELQALIDASLRGGALGLADIRVRRGTMPRVPVEANQGRLVQVLANLLTNAWHATERRGHGQVLVHGKVIGDNVHVYVDDNGPGIPPDERDKIFEAFVTSKKAGRGSGLGLALSRGFVRSMGGDLRATAGSVLGGARLEVVLPLAPVGSVISDVKSVRPATPRQRTPKASTTLVNPSTRSRTEPASGVVLVVDDDPRVLRAVSRLLEQNWVVHSASGSAQARYILRHHEVDVILCDLHLGAEDALDVLEVVGRINHNLVQRTVFMSGEPTSRRLLALARANEERLLSKPSSREATHELLLAARDGELPVLERPDDAPTPEPLALAAALSFEPPTEEISVRRRDPKNRN